MFSELSPEAGELDEDTVADSLRDEIDQALPLLAEMGAATDVKLRALARSLAGRVVVDLARGDHAPVRGIDTLARRPLRDGGDVDLDGSLDALIEARAGSAVPDLDRLVARSWVRREHALCLVVDRSGSMGGERLVSAALATAVMACRAPSDYSVVAFGADTLVIKSQDAARNLDSVIDDVLALRGFGTTDVALALRAAAAQLARSRSNRKVAVLLSDGRATAGADPVVAARGLDVLHVISPPAGRDDEDPTGEAPRSLARAGGGRWVELTSPSAVPETLMQLLR